MPTLTGERLLKAQEIILKMFEEIKLLLHSSSSLDVQLTALQAQLVRYFALEDNDFFLRLRKEPGTSPKMIDFFQEDLKGLKVKFFSFFERHLPERMHKPLKSLPKDFMELTEEVLLRFKMERDYLIPLVDALRGLSDF